MHMRWIGGAAVLMIAVLCAGGYARVQVRQHVPLTIEVVSGGVVQEEKADAPRVLIYHTHTWEAYEMTEAAQYEPTETWRTKDERYNMVRIGRALCDELTALGFSVVHDTTAFEPPNLSAAYTRSLSMLEERFAAGETYDYVFDVHRDAYSGLYNGANSVNCDGKDVAYVMLLVGKGTGTTGSGFDERPDWPKNLELAQRLTDLMNAQTPGVSREVKIKTGRFNQHVSPNALLIEVGNNRNTLEEALAACPVIAGAVAEAWKMREQSASD